MPHVGHGHGNELRERAWPVYADALRVLAQMTPAREAVAATATHHMTFGADRLTGEKVFYVRADLDHFAHEFVPNDHRHGNGFLRPCIPFVDVEIGAADAGAVHAYQH